MHESHGIGEGDEASPSQVPIPTDHKQKPDFLTTPSLTEQSDPFFVQRYGVISNGQQRALIAT